MDQGVMNTLTAKLEEITRTKVDEKITVAYVKGDEKIEVSGMLKGFVPFEHIVVDEEKIPFLTRWEAIVEITGGNLLCNNPFVLEIYKKQGWYGSHKTGHNITTATLKRLREQTFGKVQK